MHRTIPEQEGSDISFRDRWQFELKSDLVPSGEETTYTQEFYFFIPSALQINEQSFSKSQFYRDETNLIRFKTPIYTLQEIADPTLPRSPLYQMEKILNDGEKLIPQLKLLANIFRSALRFYTDKIALLVEEKKDELVQQEVEKLRKELLQLYREFERLQKLAPAELAPHFDHVRSFFSENCDQYLIHLLKVIRQGERESSKEADSVLTALILKELPLPKDLSGPPEKFLYEQGIISKYVLDALLLQTNRFSPLQKYRNWIGGIAAGIAMLIYIILFILWGHVFVINSEPFLLLTVVIYILKDRIKDAIKEMGHHRRMGWFSDFTTEIRSPDGKAVYGTLEERLSYVEPEEVAPEILAIRQSEFNQVLEALKRPESILYYNRKVRFFKKPDSVNEARWMFNFIFRFSVRHFLEKGSNPYQPYLQLEESGEITLSHFPKVYHLNIIMRTTTKRLGKAERIELKKFRLVADKNGIKRLEII